MKRHLCALAATAFLGLAVALAAPHPAGAAVMSPARTDASALNWARHQQGKPYEWGQAGPRGFDCSGLVYAAFRHAGVRLPRTTGGMLASWHLERVRTPRPGDLAFFGSGHVEFVTGSHQTFGAHKSGTRIGYRHWDVYYHPTAYYKVVG